jgi:hypothetical protein
VGIDVVGWNGCRDGAIESPDDLVDFLKLLAHKRAVDSTVPEAQRKDVTISAEDERMSYGELAEALADVESQAGSCRDCFAEDAACYAFVSYPIDTACEELLFDYFTSSLATDDSPADQIYRDYLTGETAESWLDVRSGDDRLLERGEPLRTQAARDGRPIDSTQILAVLFSSVGTIEDVTAFGVFWNGFAAFAQSRGTTSRSVSEVLRLAPLFRQTFTKAVAGASECQVLFYT